MMLLLLLLMRLGTSRHGSGPELEPLLHESIYRTNVQIAEQEHGRSWSRSGQASVIGLRCQKKT